MEKILVADKDRQILKMVSLMLDLEGYNVVTAAASDEIPKLLEKENPDVVLLDHLIEWMEKKSIISEIKATDQSIEIIIMASYGTDVHAAELLKKGASDYLVKPFSRDDLVRAVKSSLYARKTVSKEEYQPKILLASENRKDMVFLKEVTESFETVATLPLRRAYSHISTHDTDVFLADISGVEINIFDLLRKLAVGSPHTDIMLLSESKDIVFIKDAIREGAFDCITKPVDAKVVQDALGTLLDKRRRRDIESLKKRFERELIKSKEQVDYVVGIVESMIFALEARDKYTRGHSERVTRFAVDVASAMGMKKDFIDRLRHASRLHDIGKIGIDDSILRKPGRLTDDEYTVMKNHPVVGENIIKPVKHLAALLPPIRHHHERYDGKGYPDGLKEDGIPMESRIIAVVDTYDAMRSTRSYRKKMKMRPVLEEIEREAGFQLDPVVVDVFLRLAKEPGQFKEAYNE